VRTGLIVVGLIATAAGGVVGTLDLTVHAFAAPFEVVGCELQANRNSYSQRCQPSSPSPVPWMVAAGGGAMTLVGVVMQTDPLSARQRAELVRDYGRRVREQTPSDEAAPVEARPTSLRLAAAVTPAGGMMLLQGRY
jgi:hypothetical protein